MTTGGIIGGMVKSLGSNDAGRAQLGEMLVKGGAITPALMKELTGKTVSPMDVSVAEGLAKKLAGQPLGMVAQSLADGLGAKLKGQGVGGTALETAKDALVGATRHEFIKQGIQKL